MRQVTEVNFDSFVAEKPLAAIHFDADWDVSYRPLVRRRMLAAEKELSDKANFGEVDVDKNIHLAKSVGLLNVPAVGYY